MQARKRIMDILEKHIRERRGGIGTSHVDFLQQLLADDNKLTDGEIKDNILTMIIAGKYVLVLLNHSNMMYSSFCYIKFIITGQDTIAIAMTWMIKFVDENQEVLNELRVSEFLYLVISSPCSFSWYLKMVWFGD